jgi:hypothetical protein
MTDLVNAVEGLVEDEDRRKERVADVIPAPRKGPRT